MVLKIELENFFSIRDRIIIDFRAATLNNSVARSLSGNIIDLNGRKVLKTIGLFGPNASGKSNIVKAISFCRNLILHSHLLSGGEKFNFTPFKYDGCEKKASSFLVDFICGDVEYEYSFSLTREKILAEALFFYPNGRRSKVFARGGVDGREYSFGSGYVSKPSDVIESCTEKNLFLSRANSMNREVARKVYNYFLDEFSVGLVPVGELSVEKVFNDYKPLILKALSVCDSDIVDMFLKKEKYIQPPMITGQGTQLVGGAEVERLRYETVHRRSGDVRFDLDTEESSGTRKLFEIFLGMLECVRFDKSLFLDEFDAGLHTTLAEFLLDLVHASRSSQLLFTSHNTNLIDVNKLRRDQILFVNKRDDGSTDVYSLYDFKDFRETMDSEKGYLQGRFDAIPYVDTSVASIRQLLGY